MNRKRVLASTTTVIAAVAMLALALTSASSPQPTHAEGPGPGMSLTVDSESPTLGSGLCAGGDKPVECAVSPLLPFTLIVQTNDAPAGDIAGTAAEITSAPALHDPAGLAYQSQACMVESLLITDFVCVKGIGPAGEIQVTNLTNGTPPHAPVTNITPGGEHESLWQFNFDCRGSTASSHTVTLTSLSSSPFGSAYYDTLGNAITLKSDPADTLTINCLDTALDTDQDGCNDVEELGPSPHQGGRRDPANFWDFYDVPTGVFPNLTRNKAMTAADHNAVLSRFGRTGTATSVADALAPVTSLGTYHAAYDRGPPIPGGDLWDLTQANGSITAADFFATIAQFGDSCTAVPN